MKLKKMFVFAITALIPLTIGSQSGLAQSSKTYQQMSRAERSAFVAAESRRIAKELSGRDYDFTPEFEETIQQSVNSFISKMDSTGQANVRLTLERGRSNAQVVMAPFRARNLSPLMGLYIPFIESAFVNIQAPNSWGSIGMFQFMPKTGEKYGLSPADLLDVAKSADAAARYLTDSLVAFDGDPMKEALALLSYNRGTSNTQRDLKLVLNEQNRHCSICALTANRSKMDKNFTQESVYYVPNFFAAAIIGENPTAFGLQMQPLSSY